MSNSQFPEKLSRAIAQQCKEDHLREHGKNPPSHKEEIKSLKRQIDSMNEKDRALHAYMIASSSVRAMENGLLHLTEADSREEKRRSKEAYDKYLKTPGELTKHEPPLRQKVIELTEADKNKIWKVKEVVSSLGHPPKHVRVVLSFLWEEGKATNVVK